MIAVVEASGAQVLPPAGDPRTTITSWGAHLACDADARARFPKYRAVAEALRIVDVIRCQGSATSACPAPVIGRLTLECGHSDTLCSTHSRFRPVVSSAIPARCVECGAASPTVQWTEILP